MSAYDNDPRAEDLSDVVSRPELKWPGRVENRNGAYIVDESWAVMETGKRWEAWPYPACADPTFDDEGYRAEHLRGKGLDRSTADEKIRELIGDPK